MAKSLPKIEGVDYVITGRSYSGTFGSALRTYRASTPRKRKPTAAELRAKAKGRKQYRAECDAIRTRNGLELVPPTRYELALETAVKSLKPAKRAKVSRRKQRGRSTSPAVVGIPSALLAELEKLGSEYGFKLTPA